MTTHGAGVADRLRSTDIAALATFAAILVGGLVRIVHFLDRRSLWADEAALATNIVQRDFGGLLQPLDGNQGAPVLFLWAQRTMVLVGGNNEYALRLIPLAAGVALLPLVYLLGRRLGSPKVGATATVLVALAPALVRYSSEVKQYSTDAAITVGLVLLATSVLNDEESKRPLLVLAGTGALAMWASHPAVFVLAGVGIVLAARATSSRQWARLWQLAGVALAWAVSAGALYGVSLRHLGQNEFLTDFWREGFPSSASSLGGAMRWFVTTPLDILDDPTRLAWPVLGAAACIAGFAMLARKHPWHLALAVSAIPFLVLAATLERYPVQGRMVLFLVPILLLGLSGLLVEPKWFLVTLPVVGALVIGGAVDVLRTVAHPPEIAESRPVFEHVRDNWREGDQLWVHDVTIEPYQYYGPILGLDVDRRTLWRDASRCEADGDLRPAVVAASGTGRVWVVFAYTLSRRPDDEAERLRTQLAHHATIVSVFERTDASATLVDFGDASPDAATGSAGPPDPDLGCLVAVAE